MNEFFTWQYLGSFTGIVSAVTLIIQFTKIPIDKIIVRFFGTEAKIPTRFIVWVLSYLLLLATAGFTIGLTAERIVICALNAIVVSFTSMGAYEVTFKKFGK